MPKSQSTRHRIEPASAFAAKVMFACVFSGLVSMHSAYGARGYKCTLADGTVLREQDTCVGKNAVKQEDEVRTKAESDADLKAELRRMGEDRAKNSSLRIGMTKADFKKFQEAEPLGCPIPKVNVTFTGSHTREQYVCGGGRYLYFDDGILTSVQDSTQDYGP